MVYAPGTEETDPKKQNMSLQQNAAANLTNAANIATNTANIATIQAAVAALPATFVSSFKTRTGAVVPAQGDYSSDLIPGVAGTGSATAGNIGEYIESVVPVGSAVSITSGIAKTITSISLTAGDWDVNINGVFNPAATTSQTITSVSLSLTTNTQDTTAGRFWQLVSAPLVTNGFFTVGQVGPYRLSLSGATTVYYVYQSTFTVSTASAFGIIRARRVR